VFKSTTGGESWNAANSGLISTIILSLAIDPASRQTVYAGTSGSGLFKSVNGGASWSTANSGMNPSYPYIAALAIDPASTQTIYAGTWSGGAFKSTNGGGVWSAINSGLPNNASIYTLAVDPGTPQTIYAGTSNAGVFKSTIGGDSWIAINSGLTNLSVNSLTIDPDTPRTIYATTNNGGVFKTINGGDAWNPINIGLTYRYVYSLVIDPTSPQTIYIATNGGGVYKSTTGGDSWSAVNSGLGTNVNLNYLAIDPTNHQTIYVATRAGGVFKSTNGGDLWSAVNSGLTATWINALAIDPVSPQTVYAGTNNSGVFKALSDPTVPGAPTDVTATAGDGQDTVSFIPPTVDGGRPITSYTATAIPGDASGNITASGPASPITISGLTNSSAYTFTIAATNAEGAGPAAPATSNLYGVRVTLNGTGSGSINSSPLPGINCTGGTCSHTFTSGTTTNLLQSASNGSRFTEWGGACTGSGLCGVSLTTLYRSVTATFDTLPNARILGSPQLYGLLQSAYKDADINGSIIQAKGVMFIEDLTLDASRNVIIRGGFDSDFALQEDYTILQGKLTINQGGATVNRLIVRPLL